MPPASRAPREALLRGLQSKRGPADRETMRPDGGTENDEPVAAPPVTGASTVAPEEVSHASGEWTEYAAFFILLALILPVATMRLAAPGNGPMVSVVIGFGSSWIFAALGAAAVGANKGRSAVGFFLFGLAAPYIAIVAALLIDVDGRERARLFAAELRQTATPAPTRTDELSKLAALHRDGALSDDEFMELKRQLIAGTEV